jgi:hypothetical protein
LWIADATEWPSDKGRANGRRTLPNRAQHLASRTCSSESPGNPSNSWISHRAVPPVHARICPTTPHRRAKHEIRAKSLPLTHVSGSCRNQRRSSSGPQRRSGQVSVDENVWAHGQSTPACSLQYANRPQPDHSALRPNSVRSAGTCVLRSGNAR